MTGLTYSQLHQFKSFSCAIGQGGYPDWSVRLRSEFGMSISEGVGPRGEENSVDPVDRLLSYEQIRELVARYSISLDARRP